MRKRALLCIAALFGCFLLQAQNNSDFMLDSTFSLNGKAAIKRVTTGNYALATTKSVVLQNNKKIVAAGYISTKLNDNDYFLTRYLPDGSVDNSFGDNGVVYTNYKDNDFLSDMKKQSSGKLVVIGKSYNRNDGIESCQVNRYSANGLFDSSFGDKGRLLLPEISYTIAVLPDDNILVCGVQDGNNYTVTVRRFLKDGKTDSSFGQNGLASVRLGENRYDANYPLITIDSKERIVVGVTGSFPHVQNNHVVVLRFTKNGFIDSSFSKNGIANGSYTDALAIVYAIAVQADNKIVVGGVTVNDPSLYDDFFLSRFTENGTEDNSFGNKGVVTTDFTLPIAYYGFDDEISALGIQNDNKIVAVGYSTPFITTSKIAVARYLANGNLDSSFAMNGKTITPVLYGNDTRANAIAIQPDGKIITGGYSRQDNLGSGSGGYVTVIRYLKEKKMLSLTANKINDGTLPALPATHVYPNPAKDILYIEGTSAKSSSYRIITSAGGVVQTGMLSCSQIDIHHLPAGLYYMHLGKDNRSLIKFVKE